MKMPGELLLDVAPTRGGPSFAKSHRVEADLHLIVSGEHDLHLAGVLLNV